MDNDILQTLANHPRRQAFVWGTAVVFSLLFVLPAWDHYSQARTELAERETELSEISFSLANLDLMQQRLDSFQLDSSASNCKSSADAAESVRESVTRLTQQMGCRIRRLNMSDAMVRPWFENDDPFSIDSSNESEETGFVLEKRSLTLSVGGTLTQLAKLTVALNRLDPFAIPSNLTLQREGIDGHLVLDVEISLFNLAETFD